MSGGFKDRARRHQARFREEVLGLSEYRTYVTRLTEEATVAGKNFYDGLGVMEEVEKRYGLEDKKLCWDMLASDAVPFNFFVPLRHQAWSVDLVRGWAGPSVEKVTGIEIEWAPKTKYLNDRTSFDAYVTYDGPSGVKGAVGIETKFTEGAYAWGGTEKAQMFDEKSPYVRLTRASRMHRDGALDSLRTRELKQMWRNHLLLESMRAAGDVHQVTSVHLYPAGNAHQSQAARRYRELLREESSGQFVATTFEDLFARCRALCSGGEASAWLDYLERRYLVAP